MSNNKLPDASLFASFLAVVEAPSLAAAAASLGLSQPTVTQHLQRLEASLGVALFKRDTRPLALTPAGEVLARDLPALMGQISGLLARTRNAEGQARQILRMVMPDSLSCIMGAEFISASATLAKAVELRSGISPWIEEAFRARQFDLAIDSPPFDPATRADKTPLFRDPYVLVRPQSLPSLPPEEFSRKDPQVAYGRNSKFGAATAAVAEGLGATTPPRFSFDSSQSLLRFVQVGYGWAITSALCLFQSPAALRDITILPCRPDQARSFFLLARQGEEQKLARDAAERLLHVFRRLVDGPWAKISPVAAGLIRAANPEHFAPITGGAITADAAAPVPIRQSDKPPTP